MPPLPPAPPHFPYTTLFRSWPAQRRHWLPCMSAAVRSWNGVVLSVSIVRPVRSFEPLERQGTSRVGRHPPPALRSRPMAARRSEEHTSELQSRLHLVCRLLL